MPSLLLVVFVLQVALYLINTVGAAAINDFVRLHNPLPNIDLPLSENLPRSQQNAMS